MMTDVLFEAYEPEELALVEHVRSWSAQGLAPIDAIAIAHDVAGRNTRTGGLGFVADLWRAVRGRSLAALMLAVFIMAAVIGYNLLPNGSSGIGSPQPAASPSPTQIPTATPSSNVIGECLDPVSVCRGALAAGTYASREFDTPLTFAVPSDWVNNIDRSRAFGLASDGGYIGMMTGPFLGFADPECEDRFPAGVGTTLAELVATLADDPRLVTSPPLAVTVGNRPGQMVDIQIAPTWTRTCRSSDGLPAVNLLSTSVDHSGPGFGLAGTERTRVIFVDVGGTVVAINIGASDGTDLEAFVSKAMPIIESMRFTS
jgi:hypothetical protein